MGVSTGGAATGIPSFFQSMLWEGVDACETSGPAHMGTNKIYENNAGQNNQEMPPHIAIYCH